MVLAAFLPAVAWLAGLQSVMAGIGDWTSSGPGGGTVQALAIDPRNTATLYAGGVGSGVFKSADGGRSWSAVNDGLTNLTILDLATAVDVGKAINPFACRQQIAGASIQGTGPAMFEEILQEAGQITNASFVDYKIPSLPDLPDRVQPLIIEVPHPEGPYGAKGIGEAGIFAIAPAIANAIADAVGARVPDLPLTPEKVLRAIEKAP